MSNIHDIVLNYPADFAAKKVSNILYLSPQNRTARNLLLKRTGSENMISSYDL